MQPQAPILPSVLTQPGGAPQKGSHLRKILRLIVNTTRRNRLLAIIIVAGVIVVSLFVGISLASHKSAAHLSSPKASKEVAQNDKISSGSGSTTNQSSTKVTVAKSTTGNTSSLTPSSKSISSSDGKTSSGSGSGGGGGAVGVGGSPVGSENIVTTLYAYPTLSSWTQVENAAPTVADSIVDICAPDGSGSGCNGQPADAISPDWTPTISVLKSDNIKPLYYISTNYGATALSVIEGEIQNAISWYGLSDPMFDTMEPSGTCSNGGSSMSCTTYNNDLYTYAVNNGASVVMFNPGSTYGVSSADMFGSKEIIQVFEGTAGSFETTSFPSWMSSYSPDQFAATLSVGTSSTIGTDVTNAANDGIGNFYEDDEAEPPNYSTLPAYWSTEVSDVNATH